MPTIHTIHTVHGKEAEYSLFYDEGRLQYSIIHIATSLVDCHPCNPLFTTHFLRKKAIYVVTIGIYGHRQRYDIERCQLQFDHS